MKIINSDCIAAMKEMPDNSVDSIVTDPPYELGFMGKSWDASGIAFNIEVWQEALRILKPGGHLIAFSGSRTYHRMAVAIEDAGFEIRDQIQWIYGSGFPKSLDVSKAIDKSDAGIARRNRDLRFTEWMRSTGITGKKINELTESNMGNHYLTDKEQPAVATTEMFDKLRPYLPEVPEWVEQMVRERTVESENFKKREVVGTKMGLKSVDGNGHGIVPGGINVAVELDITAPATAEAKQWQGWGTALKPAHEPMVLARKPIVGTVANNVLTYGVGGLNIDGSRVGNGTGKIKSVSYPNIKNGNYNNWSASERIVNSVEDQGRWPANVIHDGSDEVVALFPSNVKGQVGMTKDVGDFRFISGDTESVQKFTMGKIDSGSAARFFYCAKASKKDRNEGLDDFAGKEIGAKGNGLARKCATCSASVIEGCECPDRTFVNPTRANHHPTVKPTDLMRYLCRLITPPAGIVLDLFMGSGSTGKAAILEGFDFIGIEQSAEYVEIAKARIAFAQGDSE